MTDQFVPDSLAARLRSRLQHGVRALLPGGFGGSKPDAAMLEELETRLLRADVGVEATRDILAHLEKSTTPDLRSALKQEIESILRPAAKPLILPIGKKPFVMLVAGVNGAGKTTTIGKLAARFRAEGRSVMLAAGDTYRAAAVEQLQRWGELHGVPVIAQGPDADPAAVAHDALMAARGRGIDVLLVDTAGRLHTRDDLMQELSKVRRVLAKLEPGAPHETLLVLDGGTGQNALRQIEEFHAAIGVTGLAITKLDGTAKAGILVAAARRFGLPIRFVGVGEAAEDLLEFDAHSYAEALVGSE